MLIYWICVVLVICFAGVILFGAPYLPTLSKQRQSALDLLDLKKGQTLLEPGSGDGRVLLMAAKQGIKAVGIELNPIMYVISRIITFRYRKDIKIIWGNFWTVKWPEADGVFLFLMDRFMPRFNKKMEASQKKPTKVASFAYRIPGQKQVKEKDGVFLYHYK